MAISMIVEFLGNTGAGKSTLVPILTRLLQDDDVMAMPVTEAIQHYTAKTLLGRSVEAVAPRALRGPILWRLFRHLISKLSLVQFSVQEPRLLWFVIVSQLRRPIPWRHRWLILRLFFRMVSEYRFLRSQAQTGEVVIFDEGFVHRTVHMFVSESEALRPDRIKDYLKWLPRSDLVIWVKSPLDTCLTRISTRGRQVRLNGLTSEDIARFVANAEQVVNVTARYLKDAGWTVVEIHNGGDLGKSTAEMLRGVAPHFSQSKDGVGQMSQ